jgi:CRISPR-associated protein Csd1
MGLLQKACETYDTHADRIGVAHSGQEPLAPVSHTITSADIEIVINSNGEFQKASNVENTEPKIIIPVTEASLSRTSAVAPHPLCEQLKYLIPSNEKHYGAYVTQLEEWVNSDYSHPKADAVLKYVKNGTVLNDLRDAGIITGDEKELKSKDDKKLIRWSVNGLGEDLSGPCWTDRQLFNSFIEYYAYKQSKNASGEKLCMITGENSAMIAANHPKGIISMFGNAKLISSNDSVGFTYRGRFKEGWQACTISYEASQKAHLALRWLASNQGTRAVYGGRTFICWNPKGGEVPGISLPLIRDKEKKIEPTDYKEQLKGVLLSYKNTDKLPKGSDIIIAAFDAGTTGRLSVTYYNELESSDFIQRLYDWDRMCCWINRNYGVQSPALPKIVECAFGVPRTSGKDMSLVVDDRIFREQMQRMISCRVDKAHIPADIERRLAERSSNLMRYDKKIRENILHVTCAVMKKFRYDRYKEEWDMALEKDKADISYQFGRLLAVYEKMENDTYSDDNSRITNALKRQTAFRKKPLTEINRLEEWINEAYIRRLSPKIREYYSKLKGEIMDKISEFDDSEWNKPLEDTYIMGYYLQRNDLYTSKNSKQEK